MSIDRLNNVQKSLITYNATKYANAKVDEKESESSNTDTLTLTKEAQQYLARKKENKVIARQSIGALQLEILKRNREQSQKNDKKAVNMAKCYKIAARIGSGNKVPLKDMRFLRENAPELYNNALLFKRINPEPKKYKSCLNREDEEQMRQRQNAMIEVHVGADDAILMCLDE